MKPSSTPIAVLGLISLVLAGCASTKDTVLPQDGPSMKAIYEGHVHEMNADNPQVIRGELGDRPIVAGEAALHLRHFQALDVEGIFRLEIEAASALRGRGGAEHGQA